MQTLKQETFLTEDRKRGFSVSNGLVAIFDSHYHSYQEFAEFVQNVMEALYNLIPITMYSRLGLRYIDTILTSNQENIDHYIVSGLRKYVPEILDLVPYALHSKYEFESLVVGRLVCQSVH